MKITKNNQFGRSMIEMLGVLAIIGVLSIGAIAGYSKAMEKHKINKTINEISSITQTIRTTFAHNPPASNIRCNIDDESSDGCKLLKKLDILSDLSLIEQLIISPSGFLLFTRPQEPQICVGILTAELSEIGIQMIVANLTKGGQFYSQEYAKSQNITIDNNQLFLLPASLNDVHRFCTGGKMSIQMKY